MKNKSKNVNKMKKEIIKSTNNVNVCTEFEKSIINANRIIEEERIKDAQPLIKWMQNIVNGLMIMFGIISFLFV